MRVCLVECEKLKKMGQLTKLRHLFHPYELCVCVCELSRDMTFEHLCWARLTVPDRQISGWPLSRSVWFCIHGHLLIFASALVGSRRLFGRAAAVIGKYISIQAGCPFLVFSFSRSAKRKQNESVGPLLPLQQLHSPENHLCFEQI